MGNTWWLARRRARSTSSSTSGIPPGSQRAVSNQFLRTLSILASTLDTLLGPTPKNPNQSPKVSNSKNYPQASNSIEDDPVDYNVVQMIKVNCGCFLPWEGFEHSAGGSGRIG